MRLAAAARPRRRPSRRAAEDHAHALSLRSRTRSCVGLPRAPSGSSSRARIPARTCRADTPPGGTRCRDSCPATSAQRTTSSPRSNRSRSSGVESRQVRAAVRRDEQEPAGPEHAAQLVPPRELQVRGQVREHRERVDEVEALVAEDERRLEAVLLEAREREVAAAPVDRRPAEVGARDLHVGRPSQLRVTRPQPQPKSSIAPSPSSATPCCGALRARRGASRCRRGTSPRRRCRRRGRSGGAAAAAAPSTARRRPGRSATSRSYARKAGPISPVRSSRRRKRRFTGVTL